MAFSIGDISFGINANSKGLRQAMTSIDKFKAKTKELARTQASGASKQIASMKKISTSLRKAAIDTSNLNKQMKKAGAAPGRFADTSNALSRLNTRLTKTGTTSKQAKTAVQSFNASLRKTREAVSKMGLDKAAKSTKNFSDRMRNLESASVLAIGPLSGLGARIRSLTAIFGRGGIAVAVFFAIIAAVTLGMIKLAAASIRVGVAMEQAIKRFTAAGGSLKVAEAQMAFIVVTSRKMGLGIEGNIKSFSRMSAAAAGTSLEGKGVKDIFIGITSAAAAMQLTVEETTGVFLAIEQMMSKGSVQAEELRGQLGERLLGAFNLAARAVGKTTGQLNDMLKSGTVLAEDFLPQFAAELERTFGKAALDNVNTFTGSFNNLKNATFLFLNTFSRLSGITTLATKAMQGLTKVIDTLRTTMVGLSGVGNALGEVLFKLTRGQEVDFFKAMNDGIKRAIGNMIEFQRVIEDMERESVAKTLVKVIRDANFELEVMRQRIVALNAGSEALRIFEDITLPTQLFKKALTDAGIEIDIVRNLTLAFTQNLKVLTRAERDFEQAGFQAGNAVVNSLEDMIFKAESLKDTLKSLALELIKIALRAAIFTPLANSLGSFFSSSFSLPRLSSAAGGPIEGGVPRLVGEKGPEIFTPSTNGSITSNANIGGGSGISITINAPGADQGTIARIRDMITEELAPQLIRAASQHTLSGVRRPKWA